MFFTIYTGFVQQAFALEVYGGSLIFPGVDGMLSVACKTHDVTQKCQSFELYRYQRDGRIEDGQHLGSFTVEESKAISAQSAKESHKIFEKNMASLYLLPTSIIVMYCAHESWSHASCLLTVPALAIDIAKAPLILPAHILLEVKDALTRKRFVKYLKYLMNPTKKG